MALCADGRHALMYRGCIDYRELADGNIEEDSLEGEGEGEERSRKSGTL